MPDDPFLSAILAAPDDDLPRLIYADWLDERGDADRAEFIRTQIELARLPAALRRRSPLAARERELLAGHEADWLGPLSEIVTTAVFRRGFVDELIVMAEAFLRHADLLFASYPICKVKFR